MLYTNRYRNATSRKFPMIFPKLEDFPHINFNLMGFSISESKAASEKLPKYVFTGYTVP
jgi:hypothetical protein